MFNKLRKMWSVGQNHLSRLFFFQALSLKTNSYQNITHTTLSHKNWSNKDRKQNQQHLSRASWPNLRLSFSYFLETYISTWAYTCVFFTLVRQYIQKKQLIQTKTKQSREMPPNIPASPITYTTVGKIWTAESRDFSTKNQMDPRKTLNYSILWLVPTLPQSELSKQTSLTPFDPISVENAGHFPFVKMFFCFVFDRFFENLKRKILRFKIAVSNGKISSKFVLTRTKDQTKFWNATNYYNRTALLLIIWKPTSIKVILSNIFARGTAEQPYKLSVSNGA